MTKDTQSASYGSQLKALRQARGLTQEQLAEKTGILNTYLSLIETGKVIPSDDWDVKIREALNWTTETNELLAVLLHNPSMSMSEVSA